MTRKKTTKLRNLKSGGNIYIPKNVLYDPSFPFSDGDEIKIEIQGNQLVLSQHYSEKVVISEVIAELTDLSHTKQHSERWYNP